MCFYHTVLDVENIGSTMINVTWKLPVHLSSALLGFQLVLTQEPASDLVEPFVFENVTLNRNEVSYTISGLGMKTILLIKLMYITYVYNTFNKCFLSSIYCLHNHHFVYRTFIRVHNKFQNIFKQQHRFNCFWIYSY